MTRLVVTYFVIGASLLLLTRTSKGNTKLNGEWKIETFIVESDTLYHEENQKFTIDFYNDHMLNKDAPNDNIGYVAKCMHSTFRELKRVRLELNRKDYNQSAIVTCWDHINFRSVNKGKYSLDGDSIHLLKADNSVLMDLIYHRSLNRLTYSNSKHDYQIIYARVSGN